eukprot:8136248-Pyramimonas_sp.AAC.1
MAKAGFSTWSASSGCLPVWGRQKATPAEKRGPRRVRNPFKINPWIPPGVQTHQCSGVFLVRVVDFWGPSRCPGEQLGALWTVLNAVTPDTSDM